MWRIIRVGTFLRCRSLAKNKLLRPFMTDAFYCKDAWNKRLNNHVLQKVKLSDLYYDLDTKFNQFGKVSAIDIDIFTNSINDNSHLDELEELVHRFHLTSEAGNILDSTHHAFIRAFLSFGNIDELMRILNDRLNYGIFPDDYCNILMMDKFIKENNFTNAAKVATIQMLQENFTNSLVKYLSLYSCHKYLLHPDTWDKAAKDEVKEDNDNDEEIKVRVDYIRNPYFDDHFDLADPYSLIGKTFKIIGESEEDSLSNSYHLLGLILYKKWPEAINCSNNILEKNLKLNSGCINEIEKYLQTLPQEEGEKQNEIQEQLDVIKNNVIKIKNNNLIDEKELLSATEEQLNLSVKEVEQKLIADQCQIYEEWEEKREELLKNELEEMKRQQRIEIVKLKKQELEKKEQELFFFDEEDQLDLQIENKRVRYPPKWLGKKKKKRADVSNYTPPEIVKQRT